MKKRKLIEFKQLIVKVFSPTFRQFSLNLLGRLYNFSRNALRWHLILFFSCVKKFQTLKNDIKIISAIEPLWQNKGDKGTFKIETTMKVEVVNNVPADDQKNAMKCQHCYTTFVELERDLKRENHCKVHTTCSGKNYWQLFNTINFVMNSVCW